MAYTITRYNSIGLMYTLTALRPGVTIIRQKDNELTVSVDFEVLNQAWYDWQQRHQLIQLAFSMLDANEREFIQTGIPPVEWESIFGPSADNDE
jgi:hypothetical protein